MKVGWGEKAGNAPFILEDGIRLLWDTPPLPNCVHITLGNPIPEKQKNSHPITPPLPPLSPQSSTGNSLGHYFIPQLPDGQIISTIDGGVRKPVLLCYSCPVQWVCPLVNPQSLHPCASEMEERNWERDTSKCVHHSSWLQHQSKCSHAHFSDS